MKRYCLVRWGWDFIIEREHSLTDIDISSMLAGLLSESINDVELVDGDVEFAKEIFVNGNYYGYIVELRED